LEPISACYSAFTLPSDENCRVDPRPPRTFEFLNLFRDGIRGEHSDGTAPAATATIVLFQNTIAAYAIDATTLGTTNKRVGTLRIDFSQYVSSTTDYFDNATGTGSCVVGATTVGYPCLNKTITATYNPLPAPNGLGPEDLNVEGFLWIQPGSSPFNYSDGVNCRDQFDDRFPTAQPIPLGQISSMSDAEVYCFSSGIQADDQSECTSRVAVLANLTSDRVEGNPCLAFAIG
jgi:hypothetical protein